MKMFHERVRSGSDPKPSVFFRAVEDGAIRIRKLLQSGRTRREASETSGSMDDAVALSELIELLARHGQTLAAEDAIDLAERVELLFDQLQAEVDSLLAS